MAATAGPDTSNDQVSGQDRVDWTPPGAGHWVSGKDHVATSVTPAMMELYLPARSEGMRAMFEAYGFPARTYGGAFVNGHLYDRVIPLIGADKPSTKLPPKPILWLTIRIHPEFRRRTKQIASTFAAERAWEAERRAWYGHERQEWIDRNLAVQEVDVRALDDVALADHLDRATGHYQRAVERHFTLKGLDSAPIGDLLALTNGVGIRAPAGAAALRGASPSSGVPPELRTLVDAVRRSGRQPSTIDELRASSPEAGEALDDYLRLYGARVVTGYDIDGRTLQEVPDVIVGSVVALLDDPRVDAAQPDEERLASLRSRVPATDRADFEERFAHAVAVYGVRDDNGPLTFQWPLGLLRITYLEIGRRLFETGRLSDPQHAVELTPTELRRLFLAAPAATPPVSADEAAARAHRRAELSELSPPVTLGPEEPMPPLDVMPEALARGVRCINAFIESMTGTRDSRAPLVGTGINADRYEGRAVVAHRPEDALAELEPGDVLIAHCTTPAYNSVLPIVGAVVTEEGGPLCHAALVARELGKPAVVGAMHATTLIHTGDTVVVDPTNGTVSVVA